MNSEGNDESKGSNLSLDAIDAGIPIVEQKDRPDEKDKEERECAIKARRLANRYKNAQIKNVRADRRLRKKYASRILKYLENYSLCALVLLLCQGLNLIYLDKIILTAVVGSTAVAAIGLVGFIARGLFKPPPPNEPGGG